MAERDRGTEESVEQALEGLVERYRLRHDAAFRCSY